MDFRSDLRLNFCVRARVRATDRVDASLFLRFSDRWMDNWDEGIIDFIRTFAG